MSAAQLFLIVFLTLFALHFALERWLSVVNTRYVQAHGGEVPEPVKDVITPETHRRSVDYTLARARFGHVCEFIGAVLTLLYLFSGLLPWLDGHLAHFRLGPLTHGVALLVAFGAINGLLDLPLELYGTFVLEARFGFNKTTFKTFCLDKLKGLLLTIVLGVPLLYALLTFVTRTGELWWLWAALFFIAVQFVMMILYPVLIAPLFNKFTPLPEGDLRTALDALSRQCAFPTRGIFVMDGSRRSGHSNAYFTGIGKARRIVLYDTLIQQMTVPELAAVLAHEIGHYKKKHILKMMFLSCALAVLGFFVLSVVLNWPALYEAFGIAVPVDVAMNTLTLTGSELPLSAPAAALGLLLAGLVSGAFTFWAAPLLNAVLRQHEYEADAYAREQTGGTPLETALLKLFEKNLMTLTPHPAFSAYHYSHPTLLERIAALRDNGSPRRHGGTENG